jgi:hypothetical protein
MPEDMVHPSRVYGARAETASARGDLAMLTDHADGICSIVGMPGVAGPLPDRLSRVHRGTRS